MTSTTWSRIRLGSVAASFPVVAIGVLALGSLTPGYSQLADPVSRLASSGERWAPEASGLIAIYGAMVIVGSGSLGQYLRRHDLPRRANLLTLLLASYGVACMVVSIAPKNQPGTPPTLISELHVSAAVIGGGMLFGAMGLVARRAASRAVRSTAIAVGVLTAAGAVALRLTWGTHVYGLNERLLLALGMGWLSALATLRWRARSRRSATAHSTSTIGDDLASVTTSPGGEVSSRARCRIRFRIPWQP